MKKFAQMMKEICQEEEIELQSFSGNWIFCFRKNGRTAYVIGSEFGLNSASVQAVCRDKSASSDIMEHFGIPHIRHHFFLSPVRSPKNHRPEGEWEKMMELLESYGTLVCKVNDGAGGNYVYKVTNRHELEQAYFTIFGKSNFMAISPYYDIENEYRVIVLDGEIRLVFCKKRPCIYGDGVRTVKELTEEYLSSHFVNLEDLITEDSARVLEKNEKYYLNWKHNLGHGAAAAVVEDPAILENLQSIVGQVSDALGIRFASVDVAETEEGYKVMEINSGVTMEHFAEQGEITYKKAKKIYKEAVLKMLET